MQSHDNQGVISSNIEKVDKFKKRNPLYRAFLETYIDPVELEVADGKIKSIPNPERSVLAGFFGFRRTDYSGGWGKVKIAWDILTWLPTVAMNIISLVTEVPELALKKYGKDQLKTAKKEESTGRKIWGWACYGTGSTLYYFGRTITSPAKNVQACFAGWSKMNYLKKGFAVGKAILSSAVTITAYSILTPFILVGVASVGALGAVAGAAYVVGHGIAALTNVPVIGPIIKTVGGGILKGLNYIPGFSKVFGPIAPTTPVFIPGVSNPAVVMAEAATAQQKAKLILNLAQFGATGGVATTVLATGKLMNTWIQEKLNIKKSNVDPKKSNIDSNTEVSSEVQEFRNRYIEKYNATPFWLRNPSSSMKQELKTITTMEKIRERAGKNPKSRTAEVLKEIDNNKKQKM